MAIKVWVQRARGLPRPRLLRSPDPFVEVHYFAGAPAVGVSTPAQRQVAPEWPDFCARIALAPGDAPPRTLGVVVRDAGYRDTVLGRCHLRVDATVTEGWFPLDADVEAAAGEVERTASGGTADWTPPQDPAAYTHPSAEIYVRVEWPEYCALQRWQGYQSFSAAEADGDPDSELRCASDQPGRFFRCGEMMVTVRALGVPVTIRDPQLMLKTHDQCLRGYESVPSATSPSTREGRGRRSGSRKRRDAGPVLSKKAYAEAKKAGTRRDVDFGSFSFAVVQGSFPERLKMYIWERGASKLHAVAARVMSVAEHTIPLPHVVPGFDEAAPRTSKPPLSPPVNARAIVDASSWADEGSDGRSFSDEDFEDERDNSFTYVIHYRATSPGAIAEKVTFDVRVTYSLCHPAATCNNVTPRFREIFSSVDSFASDFQKRFPQSVSKTYLFVGGLFTQHYPKYFDHNREFLSENLGLENIDTVPIHTEHSVASNARVIRDFVLEKNTGPNSVILISHSKGGCDVCGAIVRFPEIVPLLYGFVSFQAPFGGTYLIDLVSKSGIVVAGISGAIKGLWGGEREAFLGMGYTSRLKDILFNGDGEEPEGADTVTSQEVRQITDTESVLDSSTGESGKPDVQFSDDEADGRVRNNERDERDRGDTVAVLTDAHVTHKLRVYASVPTVSVASSAPYAVHKVRSIANAAGFASMAPAARIFSANTGFFNDGLVAPCDARIPFSDVVDVSDMMHTEPALYFSGTQYPPGALTTTALALLFEKRAKEGSHV